VPAREQPGTCRPLRPGITVATWQDGQPRAPPLFKIHAMSMCHVAVIVQQCPCCKFSEYCRFYFDRMTILSFQLLGKKNLRKTSMNQETELNRRSQLGISQSQSVVSLLALFFNSITTIKNQENNNLAIKISMQVFYGSFSNHRILNLHSFSTRTKQFHFLFWINCLFASHFGDLQTGQRSTRSSSFFKQFFCRRHRRLFREV